MGNQYPGGLDSRQAGAVQKQRQDHVNFAPAATRRLEAGAGIVEQQPADIDGKRLGKASLRIVLSTALSCLAVQEAIVDHLYGKSARTVFLGASGNANNLASAEHFGILLAGDFDGHLEKHLQQFTFRGCGLCMDEQSRLAEIVDDPLEQLVSVLAAEFDGQRHAQTARPWRPGCLADHMFVRNRAVVVANSLPQPLHRWPVVLVLVAADEAHLVVVAFGALARPSKFVSADSRK